MNRIVAKLIPLARRFPRHDSKPGEIGRAPTAGPPTVLILTASTGAGHNSVAEGLAEALRDAVPGVRVCIHEPLATGRREGWPARWYDLAAARVPRLWAVFYHLTNHDVVTRLGAAAAALLWGRRLRGLIAARQPRLVVSVHPLCARLAAHALGELCDPPPHHCVVTDLMTIHRCWAAPGVAAFYVATADAAAALSAAGVPRDCVHLTGLPLRRAFAVRPIAPPRAEAPAVLLLGGKRGSHVLEQAAQALLNVDWPLRLTIVCGDERVRRRLSRLAATRAMALAGAKEAGGTEGTVGERARVLGWRRDVAELMRDADIVVTKAGSVTLAEAFSQARPALVYYVLSGQEDGNVALLHRERLGHHVARVQHLPAAIARLRHAAALLDERRAAWWGGAAARVAAHLASVLTAEPELVHDAQSPQPIESRDGAAAPVLSGPPATDIWGQR